MNLTPFFSTPLFSRPYFLRQRSERMPTSAQ
jgi:hypothetical protein